MADVHNHFHFHFHSDQETPDVEDDLAAQRQLNRIERKVNTHSQQGAQVMDLLTDLNDRVGRQTTVVDSVVELIAGLSAQMREAADDPDQIRKIADEVDANTNRLVNSLIQDTGVEEEPLPDGDSEPSPEDPGAPESPTPPTSNPDASFGGTDKNEGVS